MMQPRSLWDRLPALWSVSLWYFPPFYSDGVLRGSTGVIYRQFSVTIVAAMGLSVLVAFNFDSGIVRNHSKTGS